MRSESSSKEVGRSKTTEKLSEISLLLFTYELYTQTFHLIIHRNVLEIHAAAAHIIDDQNGSYVEGNLNLFALVLTIAILPLDR